MGDEIRVTVIATGFDRRTIERPASVFAGAPRERERPPAFDLPTLSEEREKSSPPDPLEIPSFLQDE